MALLLMHVCSEIVYFLHCGSYIHMLVRACSKVFWSGVKYYMYIHIASFLGPAQTGPGNEASLYEHAAVHI